MSVPDTKSRDESDDTFDCLVDQWSRRDKDFKLNDPQVREQLAQVISTIMSLLAVAPPEVWQGFMQEIIQAARNTIPPEVQLAIMKKAAEYESLRQRCEQ